MLKWLEKIPPRVIPQVEPKLRAFKKILTNYIGLTTQLKYRGTCCLSVRYYFCPLLLGVGRGQIKKLEDTNNYILRYILGYGKHIPYNHL